MAGSLTARMRSSSNQRVGSTDLFRATAIVWSAVVFTFYEVLEHLREDVRFLIMELDNAAFSFLRRLKSVIEKPRKVGEP